MEIRLRTFSGVAAIMLITSCGGFQEDASLPDPVALLQLDNTTLLVYEVIGGLEVPWDLSVDPDGWVWFTEQRGSVTRVNPETGESVILLQIPDVYFRRSTGLLSKVLHPDFEQHPYVYLHYVYGETDTDLVDHISSRIVRYTFQQDSLQDPMMILADIPGRTGHNGSRMVITPDEKLWITTGDAGRPDLTQNWDNHYGKVLRMNLDGSVPDDNPKPGSRIWSVGHRNAQGITFGNDKIYISEHGPDNDDEINIIVKGGNYGWPDVQGFCDREHEIRYCADFSVVVPIYAWTPTVAVAGVEFFDHETIPEWQNSLLLTTLKAQALRVLRLDDEGEQITDYRIYFQKYFGRLRDVAVRQDGSIFLAVSNHDWHPRFQPWLYEDGLPNVGGDRIIMLKAATWEAISRLDRSGIAQLYEDPEPAKMDDEIWGFEVEDEDVEQGQHLYMTHCNSCHRPNGSGIDDYVPSLVDSEWVSGDKNRMINLLLHGPPERGDLIEMQMPVFRHLSDLEVAAIINYVRNVFGERTDKTLSADVFEARKGLID